MATGSFAYDRVWEIYKKLKPKPEDLLSPSRFFIRKGKFWFNYEDKRKRKKRDFFLFNDVLLLARKEGPSRYYLRIYITLRAQGVHIEPIEGDDYSARLVTRLRSFIFYFENPGTRTLWIREIENSIKGEHPGEDATKHLSEGTIKKESEKLVKEMAEINNQVASLLKEPEPVKPHQGEHKIKDAVESSSSDGASSESPVLKKKTPAPKNHKQKHNRRSVEPKVGNLLGLDQDFYHLNVQNNIAGNKQTKPGNLLSTPVGNPLLGVNLISPSYTQPNPRTGPILTPGVTPITSGLVTPLSPSNPFLSPQHPVSPLTIQPGLAAGGYSVQPLVNPFLAPAANSNVTPLKNPFL